MAKVNMVELGLDSKLAKEADSYKDLYIGRVVSQSKELYRVITETGELIAQVAGKFRLAVKTVTDYPAVGDFVMVDRATDAGGTAIIHHVLPRKSVLIRKAAGTAVGEQVVAANIDTIFICMSLNRDFNLRRLERYLGVAWASGAIPVIVLTKADLSLDLTAALRDLAIMAGGVEVLVTSSRSEGGLEPVKKYIVRGRTVALIGSSGVGKSTLINRLSGTNTLTTQMIRNDDKGRHTTTRRDLYILATGGMIIDTPGMRELGIENIDLANSFADIEELSTKCRFRDCTHTGEPNCAVKEAITDGRLAEDRWANYLKLKKEANYEGLNSRQIETEKLTAMFAKVGGRKNARKLGKEKNRQRR